MTDKDAHVTLTDEHNHILESNTNCWCKPILKVINGDNFFFHKDKNGRTAIDDYEITDNSYRN